MQMHANGSLDGLSMLRTTYPAIQVWKEAARMVSDGVCTIIDPSKEMRHVHRMLPLPLNYVSHSPFY